jgi:hypothetical protein
MLHCGFWMEGEKEKQWCGLKLEWIREWIYSEVKACCCSI